MCKKNINMISGRVLLQTLPSKAYDTEATINHAKKLVSVFEANGIPKFVSIMSSSSFMNMNGLWL